MTLFIQNAVFNAHSPPGNGSIEVRARRISLQDAPSLWMMSGGRVADNLIWEAETTNGEAMVPTPAKVLCVCTGNICRSPAMQLWLTREWGEHTVVTSAGTYAMVGWNVPDEMVDVMKQVGLDGADHEPTQLDEAAIDDADLILVAASEHRNWIVSRVPEAADKTFLLTEAAALAEVVPQSRKKVISQRIVDAAPLLASARSALAGRRHEDILDPYNLSSAHHVQSMKQMRDALDQLVAWFGG